MGCFHRRVAVCALLIAYVVLFMISISVLTEVRISKFEAIQGAKLLKLESPWTSFTPIDRKKPSPSATESEAQHRMGCFHRRVAVCALLVVVLFMSSVSVLTEARISKFEAIQGAKLLKLESPWTSFTPIDRKDGMPSQTCMELKSLVLQRRNLRPSGTSPNSPRANPSPNQKG
ncbi:hypothetical protein NC651_015768 [Populus alba x Populus x berolinensis]|nr:hypothetical protein NC651_015768 [Populus alba x Populus x berolinensis]